MSFGEAIKSVFSQYVGFKGRARRSEFWYFILFNFIMGLILGIVSKGILSTIYAIAVFLPSLAVAIRRLHDTGKSGFWYLLGLIPLVGAIILIVFYCQDSQPGDNQWGENPKEHRKSSAMPTIQDRNQTINRDEEMIRCQFCGGYHNKYAKFCASCGKEIMIYGPKIKACPKCGEEYKDGQKFCAKCGTRMPEDY